jgi:hypothetical protein
MFEEIDRHRFFSTEDTTAENSQETKHEKRS